MFQHVNVTRILSAQQLMLTAAVTSTLVNATRTSVSILPKRHVQLVTHELLSTPTHAAQLLDAVKLRHTQLLQLAQQQVPLQSLTLQSPISQRSHQSPSVLMLKVANDVMVKAGLLNNTHAISILVMLSMIFESLTVNVDTHVLHARQPNVKSLMLLMNVVLSTHVKPRSARTSRAQTLYQHVNTMKI